MTRKAVVTRPHLTLQVLWSWDGPFVLNEAGRPDLGSVHPSVTRHRLPLERCVTLTEASPFGGEQVL